jgi:RNA polymerase sigma-70 factor, ECF subfamily
MPNPDNVERLYDAHASALFGFLLNLTRNEADARDLLQEVFLKLARHPGLLAEARDERAFLLRLAHNLAIDQMRRTHTRERSHDRLSREICQFFEPSDDPDEATFRRLVSEAMEQLPPDQRAVLHLKLWADLTFDATAATLDIPLNTAASRYRYALDKLRHLLRPLYDEIK